MKDLIIAKNSVTTYAYGATSGGFDNINSLADGAISFLEDNGTLISSTVPAPTRDYFMVCLGRTTDGVKKSNLIYRPELTYEKVAYTAPVAKVMTLGNNSSAQGVNLALTTITASTAGSVVGVIIEDLEKPVYDNSRKMRYEYVTKEGDTHAIMIAGIIAKITADANKIATVAAYTSNYGLVFTGVTAGYNFRAVGFGLLEDAYILEYKKVNGAYNASSTGSESVAVHKGYGTAAQISILEQLCSAEDGNTNRVEFADKMWTVSSRVEALNYDVYVLRWRNPRTGDIHPLSAPDLQELYIAVTTGNTNISGAIDTILASL